MRYIDMVAEVESENFNLSKEERDKYDKLWLEGCDKSGKAFEKIKHRLSKELVHTWKNGSFHDDRIYEISVKERMKGGRPEYDAIITLRHAQDTSKHVYTCQLIHKDMKSIKASILFGLYDGYQTIDYMYGEICEHEEDKDYLEHNFVVLGKDYGEPGGSEINIVCKKIIWKVIEKEG